MEYFILNFFIYSVGKCRTIGWDGGQIKGGIGDNKETRTNAGTTIGQLSSTKWIIGISIGGIDRRKSTRATKSEENAVDYIVNYLFIF